MPDISKHEILLNDILQIETQITVLRNNLKDSFERNKEYEGYLNALKKENIELRQKISELEDQLNSNDINTLGSLNPKEKEALKIKLQNLISRIDYHLSS